MENAVDALKIAFAVFVFVIAIGIAFTVFSQARAVADQVIYYTDKTNYEEYIPNNAENFRIVGLETVIPAIRRYISDNEGYSVEIRNASGTVLYSFELQEDGGDPQIYEKTEENLKKIIKYYAGKQFKEYFGVEIYKGDEFEDNGEIIKKKNTDERVKITYIMI